MSRIGQPLNQSISDSGFDKFLNRPFEGLSQEPSDFQQQTGYSYQDLVENMEGLKAKQFTTTIAFTSTDYRTVTWAAGTIEYQDGKTTPNIATSNTGNMSARTYIYYDPQASKVALQTTTTASEATKGERILLAIAVPNSNTNGKAEVQTFGATGMYVANLSVEHLTAGTIRSKQVTLAVTADAGDCFFNAGKCFGKGTKILMYDGSVKKVENIVVNDLIMGDDSTPRKVLRLGRGQEEMFRVTLRNGDGFVCNKSHILSLKRTALIKKSFKFVNGKKILHKKLGYYNIIKNITIKDYLSSDKWFKYKYKAYRNKVEFKYINVPIDPYFLGLWLGDGTSKSVAVTSVDKEIIDFLQEYAFKLGLKCRLDDLPNNKAKCVRITTGYQGNMYKDSLQKELRKLGVLGNKHIPKEYLVNNRETRLALLAGLIDSDGSKSSLSYEFSQKNEVLFDQTKQLALSLGFSVGKKNYKVIKGVKYFRTSIGGDFSDLPIRVERKIIVKKKRRRNPALSAFTVKPLGTGNYYGFNIDGNKLFLLDNYIVCHNTDFTNTQSGFILGIDDSDSDKAKFYIGNSSNYLNWTGSALNITGSITITGGNALTKGGTSQALTGDINLNDANIKIDGANKRIIINDGTNDRILIGYQAGGF